METILQVWQSWFVFPPARGGPLTNRKENCKFHIIHSIWPWPKLAKVFRFTERLAEWFCDSCKLCVTGVPPKPRIKEACGRAIGTKSRVLQQEVCFRHSCPPPEPELLLSLLREGETLVREGGSVQCWRTRNSYLWLVRMLVIYPCFIIYIYIYIFIYIYIYIYTSSQRPSLLSLAV